MRCSACWGAVVFLAGFYFLCYRTPLNEVWLPTTMNNDEALYNRQVVSVLTHGGPQGYFGYQESTADIGRYGTWGPLLIGPTRCRVCCSVPA